MDLPTFKNEKNRGRHMTEITSGDESNEALAFGVIQCNQLALRLLYSSKSNNTEGRRIELEKLLRKLRKLEGLSANLSDELHSITLNNIGCLLKDAGKYRQAAKAFKKAIELDNRDCLTYLNYSSVLLEIGNHAAITSALFFAKEALDKVSVVCCATGLINEGLRGLIPYLPLVQYNYAQALQANRNYTGALAWLKKSISSAHKFRPDLLNLFEDSLDSALEAQAVRESKTLGPRANKKFRYIRNKSRHGRSRKAEVSNEHFDNKQMRNRLRRNMIKRSKQDEQTDSIEYVSYVESQMKYLEKLRDTLQASSTGKKVERDTRSSITVDHKVFKDTTVAQHSENTMEFCKNIEKNARFNETVDDYSDDMQTWTDRLLPVENLEEKTETIKNDLKKDSKDMSSHNQFNRQCQRESVKKAWKQEDNKDDHTSVYHKLKSEPGNVAIKSTTHKSDGLRDKIKRLDLTSKKFIFPCSILVTNSVRDVNRSEGSYKYFKDKGHLLLSAKSARDFLLQDNESCESSFNESKNEPNMNSNRTRRVLWRRKPSRWCEAIISVGRIGNNNKLNQPDREYHVKVDQKEDIIFIRILDELVLEYKTKFFVNHWKREKTFEGSNPTYKDLGLWILKHLTLQDGKWTVHLRPS